MLDAYIIDLINREKQEQEYERNRPRLELPVPRRDDRQRPEDREYNPNNEEDNDNGGDDDDNNDYFNDYEYDGEWEPASHALRCYDVEDEE